MGLSSSEAWRGLAHPGSMAPRSSRALGVWGPFSLGQDLVLKTEVVMPLPAPHPV